MASKLEIYEFMEDLDAREMINECFAPFYLSLQDNRRSLKDPISRTMEGTAKLFADVGMSGLLFN